MSNKEPVTLEAAKAEMNGLQIRLLEIEADLGSKVLENDDGSRLSKHEYWREREAIKDEKLEVVSRYRFLKQWVRKKNGEMNRSLRDEFAMHMLPRGWKPETEQAAKEMAHNCYLMADAMLEARQPQEPSDHE